MATPTQLLKRLSAEYPNAWANAEYLRKGKGQPDLGDWPPWCWLPLAGWYSVLSAHFNTDRLNIGQQKDLSALAAAGAWRYSKGIYRYSPEIFEAVYCSPPKGDMPAGMLKRLPEWCVYIEVPPQLVGNYKYLDHDFFGFFAHLEEDANTGGEEFRILVLGEDGWTHNAIVHMGPHTITEGVEKAGAVSFQVAEQAKIALPGDAAKKEAVGRWAADIYGLVSLALYLCADEADIASPKTAPPKGGRAKLKKGHTPLVEAPKVNIYQVGETLARQIREVETRERGPVGERAAPRPHLRRGHWHHYWTGPRKPQEGQKQKLTVHFIMPALVGGKGE